MRSGFHVAAVSHRQVTSLTESIRQSDPSDEDGDIGHLEDRIDDDLVPPDADRWPLKEVGHNQNDGSDDGDE